MKTKDLIKMLQDADPSGEGYVRMAGGVPYHAEPKNGYWDGPYSYIDDNGNYVYSIEGYKVDLCCKDITDFVQENVDENTTWEEVERKFIFKLGGYATKEQHDQRAESILKEAKEAFEFVSKLEKDSLQKSINDAVQRLKEGWRHFQNKDVDKDEKPNIHKYYTWKFKNHEGKYDGGSNLYMTEGLQKSDLFERIDNNAEPGYYEWILKNKAP